MNYQVLVVGPSGMTRYLCRGKEVEYENRTIYSSPSAAYRALDAYQRAIEKLHWKVKPLLFVINKDGEYV